VSDQDVNKSFLGTGWGFPPEFARNGKTVKLVSNDDDIRESLLILLSTAPGERVMSPEFGCGLKALAFSDITSSVVTEIKDMIENAVLFYEPRISLDGIDIDTGELAEGLLKIGLNYTIRATNSRSNMVYPFYVLEGTNIRS